MMSHSIGRELKEHLPFSVAATAAGLVVAGLLCRFVSESDPRMLEVFHLFHPVHMLLSAAATTAMFRAHGGSVVGAAVVGAIGAVVVCGASDILIPHASLSLLGVEAEMHACLVEEPVMVLAFAFMGVVIGMLASQGDHRHGTVLSHSLHVFVSAMASILYIAGSYGGTEWIGHITAVFLFSVVAVIVPCCLSDILFPLCVSKGRP